MGALFLINILFLVYNNFKVIIRGIRMNLDQLSEELNQCMNYEYESAYYYLAACDYCRAIDLEGFANFFVKQAEEEYYDAQKLFDFIDKYGGRVKVKETNGLKANIASLEEAFQVAFDYEHKLTEEAYNLFSKVEGENKESIIDFLKEFADHQVEEEHLIEDILARVESLNKDDEKLHKLDQELLQIH